MSTIDMPPLEMLKIAISVAHLKLYDGDSMKSSNFRNSDRDLT